MASATCLARHCRATALTSSSFRSFSTSRVLLWRPPKKAPRKKPQPLDMSEDRGEFEKLFRKSAFVHLGQPKGQRVVAKVIETRDDINKAYVDFGCKFHAVVDMPKSSSRKLCRGDRVVIELKDTEVTDHIVGMPIHFSIMEGSAMLVRSM